MITIRKHPIFTKHYRKRILSHPALHRRFKERFAWFCDNPHNPVLTDHPLKGDKSGKRAFSITGDIRVIYTGSLEKEIVLLDIGTHNQVYK
jgi:mRNA-degrading endonuclease YafQ of YafQ-DinJ toxin-antitoxin module